jgi:pimeloyl-ACP methyl ester carboxylesterase
MARIESFLSARLFLAPQRVDDRIYFIGNMSGRMSLYRMDAAGSVPELLLPPDIALQNPELIAGVPYWIFPKLGKILVMIDHDGDENYQPMVIPIDGGFPEPAFGERFADYRVACLRCDEDRNIAYFNAQSRKEPLYLAYQGNLETGSLTKMYESKWGAFPLGVEREHRQVVLADGYTAGDEVLYLWKQGDENARLLYGTPLEQRGPDQKAPMTGFGAFWFTPSNKGFLFSTVLFDDLGSLGYMSLTHPQDIRPVSIEGTFHQGIGEFNGVSHLKDNQYSLAYNIDGCSWLYEATFDEAALRMRVDHVICGGGKLASGVLEHVHYDKASDSYVLSFSSATSPTQLYIVSGNDREILRQLTQERVLGIPQELLSPGEDASFTSFDGLRISARLYLPAPTLGFQGPRPLVYYVHGGPQSQERPNFAWFSMPLIQFLTLNGFAVFVPNARGSTGYGMAYMKHVDRDWGGQDRLDHVHALECLAQDRRVDVKRAAVVGRSYGGYMTLTLASRHPELWSAACDMFGPYNLMTFMERIPETWKPYFALAIGDPATDMDFLRDRSPVTHIDNVACPLLVIQGKNDPRVVEQESRDLVERLCGAGKTVEYLMFENEGHDVLKYENRVRCYNAITDFFKQYLKP